MAVNREKLLPSSKGGAIVKAGFGNISKSFFVGKKTENVGKNATLSQSQQYNDQSIAIIQKSLIDIESLLKSVLTEDKSVETTRRLRREREDVEKRETKLETPKEKKKFNLPKVSLPGMSFLDRIKRFLFFTALGWLFTTFQEQLPRLVGIIKIITPIYGFVENTFKFILESVVSFIDRGYETYDKIRNLVKTIGGEKAQEQFDNLSSKLNEYINYVLIGGMALSGAIAAFTNNVKNYRPPKPSGPGGGSGGPASSRPQRGLVSRVVRPAKAAAIRTSRSVIGKQATRQLLRLVKGPLSRLPILGGLVEFGLSWALGDPPGKAAFRGVGTLLLGTVGSLIMPGFGTFAGGFLGAELAGKLYEVLFENKKPQEKPIQQQRSGGRIRGYAKGGEILGDPGRTITVQRNRKKSAYVQTTLPGKDVGGQKEIKKLYPNPRGGAFFETLLSMEDWNKQGGAGTYADYLREYNKRRKKPDAYIALTGVANILKDIPFGIGALMGSAVDVALGQRLSEATYDSINSGLQSLFDTISYASNAISSKVSQGVLGVQKEISTMQYGGTVKQIPRTSGIVVKEIDPIQVIAKGIKQKVQQALNLVKKEISVADEDNKVKKPGETGPSAPPSRGPGGGGGGGATPDGSNGKLPESSLKSVGPGGCTGGCRLWTPAANSYLKMKEAAAKEKIYFKLESAYRSYDHQAELYEDYINGRGNFASPPGQSDHGWGKAIDLYPDSAQNWVRKNGRNYGWVWPPETGEPWHFVYVGGGRLEPQKPQQTPSGQPQQQTPPGQPTKAKKTYNGLTSFYGVSGNEPELKGTYYERYPDRFGYDPGKRTTASGQPFIPSALTAAHKTLPFGTKLRVTNPNNGKSVIVTVNDRGPFSGNRVLDLSYGAAKAIGMIGSGEINAKIEELKGGGLIQSQKNSYIPKQSPNKNLSSLQSYPTYSKQKTSIVIQPVIVRQKVPMPVPI